MPVTCFLVCFFVVFRYPTLFYFHITTFVYSKTYFVFQDWVYSFEKEDLSTINVMLNCKDVSEYLKISADGVEVNT